MRTFLTNNLTLNPTNQAAALAWVREWSGDKPISDLADDYPLGSLTDVQWQAHLTLNALTIRDSSDAVIETYYLPHVTAAKVLKANPYWLQRERVLGETQEFRDLNEIVGGILEAGIAWEKEIERLEAAVSRAMPNLGASFTVVY